MKAHVLDITSRLSTLYKRIFDLRYRFFMSIQFLQKTASLLILYGSVIHYGAKDQIIEIEFLPP